ncbi:MAG: methyltransferase domain-containing protein [Candidatus Endonucleobacter sp. (ex Gigantidas childressi)]|nr:methyltransferase domain-containing protein [Candidatus Endonucleobacter sp. (ex Gigantidas childressi)]
MVNARSSFLSSGHYAAIANTLARIVIDLTADMKRPVIVDAGCGEGYYTQKIKQSIVVSDVIGFDISKVAIQSCSKTNKTVQWLVASVNDIPLLDHQVDIIISVFSRCNWQEFGRLLKPGGIALVVGPLANHLQELREAIYQQVRPYSTDKFLQELPTCFALKNTETLQRKMSIFNTETIINLLTMTPHYWRISSDKKEKLLKLNSLICTYHVHLSQVQYAPHSSVSPHSHLS